MWPLSWRGKRGGVGLTVQAFFFCSFPNWFAFPPSQKLFTAVSASDFQNLFHTDVHGRFWDNFRINWKKSSVKFSCFELEGVFAIMGNGNGEKGKFFGCVFHVIHFFVAFSCICRVIQLLDRHYLSCPLPPMLSGLKQCWCKAGEKME